MSGRRGGIPGPESRTGLVRPTMSEAEFERQSQGAEVEEGEGIDASGSAPRATVSMGGGSSGSTGRRTSSGRSKASKPKRVQRMFAIEEDLDKKLWLYAIHLGKDRSDVVNDLLRPVVASMVLYDSRDRRSGGSRAAAGAESMASGESEG